MFGQEYAGASAFTQLVLVPHSAFWRKAPLDGIILASNRATEFGGPIQALVNLNDFADRPPRGLEKGEVLTTGQYRFRFQPTPHLPHGWDAGMLFEETQKILFCSDLFHQVGEVEPFIESDAVLERSRAAMIGYQAGPLIDYVPYTHNTKLLLRELADLQPETLAIMHGSSFKGNGGRLLQDLGPVFKEVFGGAQK